MDLILTAIITFAIMVALIIVFNGTEDKPK